MYSVSVALADIPYKQSTILAIQYVEMAYLLPNRVAKITIHIMEMGVIHFASLSNILTVMSLM